MCKCCSSLHIRTDFLEHAAMLYDVLAIEFLSVHLSVTCQFYVKTNKCRKMPSSLTGSINASSFWRYKVHQHIRILASALNKTGMSQRQFLTNKSP